MQQYDYVFLGLSITSSWGNGHATTYRGLVRELAARGHRVLFLERDLDFYASNRDLAEPPYCTTGLYRSLEELRARFAQQVRDADMVVLGSYVSEGAQVGRWVTQVARGAVAFYDLDTPVTISKLVSGDHEYINPSLIPAFDLYLSFTGGPTLRLLERRHGARRAAALYCAADPELYWPEPARPRWDLGYLGTYSADRRPTLEALLLEPARRWPEGHFNVSGPQYPGDIIWPLNVEREVHLAPKDHRGFYRAQRYTLNVTRRDMVQAGWSPSVRLFEAAACGTPIISDGWAGLEDFLQPDREILVAEAPEQVLEILRERPEEERLMLAERARRRVIAEHTAAHRAETLERLTMEALDARVRAAVTA